MVPDVVLLLKRASQPGGAPDHVRSWAPVRQLRQEREIGQLPATTRVASAGSVPGISILP